MPNESGAPLVLDTHIVLDMFVFKDPAYQSLRSAMQDGQVQWVATQPMLDELQWVWVRPYLAPWLVRTGMGDDSCQKIANEWAKVLGIAPPCPLRCKDPSDQCFIDLAVQLKAPLLSKDKAVLRLAARLARLGVGVGTTLASAQRRLAPALTPRMGI
jgi:predicted nucleic acid-binding protein